MAIDENREDKYLKKEAIDFFRSLINAKITANKSTRPTNFAGHIGRHMRPELKKWFLTKYPNNSDFVNFFHENNDIFFYDCTSGDVRLITTDRRFVTPRRLPELEELCVRPEAQLPEVSANVSELELFLLAFEHFVHSYELNKTVELSARRLSEVFSNVKYQPLFRKLSTIIANPVSIDLGLQFEVELLNYLSDNYSSVFAVDKHKNTVRLHQQVIEAPLKKVSQELDDIVYAVFKHLVAKYLAVKGQTDVDELLLAIDERHEFIVHHIFGQKQTCDDFHLLDFVMSYPDDFTFQKGLSKDGHILRLIGLKSDPALKAPEVFQSMSDNTSTATTAGDPIDSDDEIYFEDEDEEELIEHKLIKSEPINESVDESMDQIWTQFGQKSANSGQQLIDCCAHKDDDKSSNNDLNVKELIFKEMKKWSMEHKICLLSKLVRNLKLEFDKQSKPKSKAVQTIDIGVQTVSTGAVHTRINVTSGDCGQH